MTKLRRRLERKARRVLFSDFDAKFEEIDDALSDLKAAFGRISDSLDRTRAIVEGQRIGATCDELLVAIRTNEEMQPVG